MKKIVVVVLMLYSVSLQAQYLGIDVPGFFVDRYSINFELPSKSTNTFGINGSFTNRLLFISGSNSNYSEYTIGAEYRYYVSPEKSTDGYFAGLYAKYRGSNYKSVPLVNLDPLIFFSSDQKTDVTSSGFAIGVFNGFKWITSQRLFFEFDLGIGKFVTNTVSYSNSETEKGSMNSKSYLPYFGNKSPIDLIFSLKAGARLGKL